MMDRHIENRAQHSSDPASHLPFDDPCSLVTESLIPLIQKSNSVSFPIILECVLEFPVSAPLQVAAKLLLKALVYFIPAQFISMFLSETFRKLEYANSDEVRVLMDSIAILLLSNRGPLGYTAVELASNFLKMLRKQRPIEDLTKTPSEFATPAGTVFSIYNCFTALLRNSNLAIQKYDIISSVIDRAFLPRPAKKPTHTAGHHSIITVSLNGLEEAHYRNVVWGVLFACAEEKDAFKFSKTITCSSDSSMQLMERLFSLVEVPNTDFQLNALVLWHSLLENGFPVIFSRPGNSFYHESLNKGSVYVIAKTRLIFGDLYRDPSVPHVAMTFKILSSLCGILSFPAISMNLIFSIASLRVISERMSTSVDLSFIFCFWLHYLDTTKQALQWSLFSDIVGVVSWQPWY